MSSSFCAAAATRARDVASSSGRLKDHVHLDEMDVRQFVMAPEAQAVVCEMQVALLEAAYEAFGRADDSAERFNIVLPSSFGSDRRKPVTAEFQTFCERVYWPLMNALLFGQRAWAAVEPHLTCFKVNTLRISEDEFYYRQPIYHFHLDHRIGPLAPKDATQRRTMRLIFSIVPAALSSHVRPASPPPPPPPSSSPLPPLRVTACRHQSFDSTVYLTRQPPQGFHSNVALHRYMEARFPERGLSAGRSRPLYEVADAELYRAVPGEVCTHHSHPGRPIHAETNPCPEGRGLYVLDWEDIAHVHRADAERAACEGTGDAPASARQRAACRALPCTRMPIGTILDAMRVTADARADAFDARLGEVEQQAQQLLPEAGGYQGGREAVERVRRFVHALRRGLDDAT